MRKIRYNILALLALISLGFALPSCQSLKDVPTALSGEEGYTEGNTYFNFQISTGQALRADNPNPDPEDAPTHNELGYWEGNDYIENIVIFLWGEDGKVQYLLEPDPKLVSKASDSQNAIYSLQEPRLTTPGKKELYVLVNLKLGSALHKRLLAATTAAAFKEAIKVPLQMTKESPDIAASDYARANVEKDGHKYDVILMTAPGIKMDIAPQVSKKAAVDHPTNSATIKVRRVLAKVLVTRGFDPTASEEEARYEMKDPASGDLIMTLSDFSYSIMQMEKTSSLIAVRDEKLDFDNTTNLHKETFTKHHDWVPTDLYTYADAKDKYAYDNTAVSSTRLFPFNRELSKPEQIARIASLNEHMLFLTETTHRYGVRLDENAGVKTAYRKGNTAYVLIRCKITPAESMFGPEGLEEDGTGNLYYGLIDGKFYRDVFAAEYENNGDPDFIPPPPLRFSRPSPKYITFIGGYSYYLLWINPDVIDPTEWKNSPVIRNNIYHINILGFNSLGFTGNPLNPSEEDNPHPVDEMDTVPDPSEPLYNKERMVEADISVLKWRHKSAKVQI